jgi:hypothetical protein
MKQAKIGNDWRIDLTQQFPTQKGHELLNYTYQKKTLTKLQWI